MWCQLNVGFRPKISACLVIPVANHLVISHYPALALQCAHCELYSA